MITMIIIITILLRTFGVNDVFVQSSKWREVAHNRLGRLHKRLENEFSERINDCYLIDRNECAIKSWLMMCVETSRTHLCDGSVRVFLPTSDALDVNAVDILQQRQRRETRHPAEHWPLSSPAAALRTYQHARRHSRRRVTCR